MDVYGLRVNENNSYSRTWNDYKNSATKTVKDKSVTATKLKEYFNDLFKNQKAIPAVGEANNENEYTEKTELCSTTKAFQVELSSYSSKLLESDLEDGVRENRWEQRRRKAYSSTSKPRATSCSYRRCGGMSVHPGPSMVTRGSEAHYKLVRYFLALLLSLCALPLSSAKTQATSVDYHNASHGVQHDAVDSIWIKFNCIVTCITALENVYCVALFTVILMITLVLVYLKQRVFRRDECVIQYAEATEESSTVHSTRLGFASGSKKASSMVTSSVTPGASEITPSFTLEDRPSQNSNNDPAFVIDGDVQPSILQPPHPDDKPPPSLKLPPSMNGCSTQSSSASCDDKTCIVNIGYDVKYFNYQMEHSITDCPLEFKTTAFDIGVEENSAGASTLKSHYQPSCFDSKVSLFLAPSGDQMDSDIITYAY